jgi:hypothetical protein
MAEINDSDHDEALKQRSRMELEAMAQAATREGLSKDQVAYEQWVDTQPIENVVAWDEMGEEGRRKWVEEHMGGKVEFVVEVQAAVEREGNVCISSGTFILAHSEKEMLILLSNFFFRARNRLCFEQGNVLQLACE